jgi:hypothetical protein
MSDILDTSYAPSPQAVESRVADELVLLHLGSETYFSLDPVGTRMWELLAQGLAPRAMCEAIVAEFDVELPRVLDDARGLLADLLAHDLVVAG